MQILDNGSIMDFIHILIEVLNCTNCAANFNVNVSIVLYRFDTISHDPKIRFQCQGDRGVNFQLSN